jgi:hypothetical protein
MTKISGGILALAALALLVGALGLFSQPTQATVTVTASTKYAKKDGTATITIVDSNATNGTAGAPTTVNVSVTNANRGVLGTTFKAKDADDGAASTFTLVLTVKEQASTVTVVDGVGQVPGFEGDSITVSYNVFTKDILVDNIGPVISNVSPSSGAVSKLGVVNFSADITDTGSGFIGLSTYIDDFSSVFGKVSLEITQYAANGTTVVSSAVISGSNLTYTAITNGWNIKYSPSIGSYGLSTVYGWKVIGIDRGGNTGTKDNNTSASKRLTVDSAKPIIKASNVRTEGTLDVTVTSTTGAKWDGTKAGVADPTVGAVLVSSRAIFGLYTFSKKGVLVVFDEKGGLDAGTVEPSDFTVGGVAPVAALTVDILEDSEISPYSGSRRPQEVFLTMGDNLATNAKPRVTLVGTVKDVAGNAAASATVYAADGLPPSLSMSASTAYTNYKATVTISSDETLLTGPTFMSGATADTLAAQTNALTGATGNATTAAPTVIPTGASSWIATIYAGGTAEKLNLKIRGADVAGNTGSKGSSNANSASAITIQLDRILNNALDPEFTVAGTKILGGGNVQTAAGGDSGVAASIEVVDPLLITVDWSRQCSSTACAAGGEKTEYAGDSHKTVEMTKSEVKVTGASGYPTTVEHTLSTADSIKYTIAIANAPTGTYTITVNGKDQAGNVSTAAGSTIPAELKATFKVGAPRPVSLSMQPGWNLISLPFQPSNPAINTILPATHPASLVLAYDKGTGLWGVSRRDPTSGLFVGDVSQITALTGYFIFTNSLEPISLLRPGLSTAAAAPSVPPAVTVSPEWNLVPVLTNAVPVPLGVEIDTYLGTLVTATGTAGWLKALVWNTATQTWTSIAPNTVVSTLASVGDTYTDRCGTVVTGTAAGQQVKERLCRGEGVWLWATINGVIVP